MLEIAPSVKIGTCLDIKSSAFRFEDVPLSKFKILGCKNEGGVGVVSIGLLEFAPTSLFFRITSSWSHPLQ